MAPRLSGATTCGIGAGEGVAGGLGGGAGALSWAEAGARASQIQASPAARHFVAAMSNSIPVASRYLCARAGRAQASFAARCGLTAKAGIDAVELAQQRRPDQSFRHRRQAAAAHQARILLDHVGGGGM